MSITTMADLNGEREGLIARVEELRSQIVAEWRTMSWTVAHDRDAELMRALARISLIDRTIGRREQRRRARRGS